MSFKSMTITIVWCILGLFLVGWFYNDFAWAAKASLFPIITGYSCLALSLWREKRNTPKQNSTAPSGGLQDV